MEETGPVWMKQAKRKERLMRWYGKSLRTASIPLAYHGTRRTFDSLELGSDVSNPLYGEAAPDHGLGIFFTNNLTMAKWFAGLSEYDPEQAEDYIPTGRNGVIMVARLNIANPWTPQDQGLDEEDPGQAYFNAVTRAGNGTNLKRLLAEQGHDGVVVKGMTTNYYGEGTYDMYVIFDPGQAEILQVIGGRTPGDNQETHDEHTDELDSIR
jgi:hypothetical protein